MTFEAGAVSTTLALVPLVSTGAGSAVAEVRVVAVVVICVNGMESPLPSLSAPASGGVESDIAEVADHGGGLDAAGQVAAGAGNRNAVSDLSGRRGEYDLIDRGVCGIYTGGVRGAGAHPQVQHLRDHQWKNQRARSRPALRSRLPSERSILRSPWLGSIREAPPSKIFTTFDKFMISFLSCEYVRLWG
jgi:hypothetical protein